MGNKGDFPLKTISKEKGKNLAEKYKFLTYKEVSALEGTKISEVMDIVLTHVEKN